MLLCLVWFCWQCCLAIVCYMTSHRLLFRMTKWTLPWTASQERGCVGFGQHQAARRGGEKQDGIGTGHGHGHREPLGKLHSPLQPGPGAGRLQVQFDASVQALPFVMNFLHVVRGCFVFPWLIPHCDSAALSSPYSVLLSLPADWGGRRPVITDGALLFTPPHPRPHTGLQPASAHASLCISRVCRWLPQDKAFLLSQLLLPLPHHSRPL